MATYFGSSTAQKEAARLHRCAVFVVIGCVTSNKLFYIIHYILHGLTTSSTNIYIYIYICVCVIMFISFLHTDTDVFMCTRHICPTVVKGWYLYNLFFFWGIVFLFSWIPGFLAFGFWAFGFCGFCGFCGCWLLGFWLLGFWLLWLLGFCGFLAFGFLAFWLFAAS